MRRLLAYFGFVVDGRALARLESESAKDIARLRRVVTANDKERIDKFLQHVSERPLSD